MDSSTGYPYCLGYSTNAKLFEEEFDFLYNSVVERLNLLLHFDGTSQSPEELVQMRLIDPMRFFIKNEPTKVAKLRAGRQRLIWSLSRVDNLIAALLFSPQNIANKLTWSTIPCKPGMGLTDDDVASICDSEYGKALWEERVTSDVSSWDYTYQSIDYEMNLTLRTRLCRGKDLDWGRIARSHYYCVQRAVYVMADGRMYAQRFAGMMKSGWFLTSSDNSAARVMVADVAQSLAEGCYQHTDAIANGDDCICYSSCDIDSLIIAYNSLGRTLRDIVPVRNGKPFEFCSTMMCTDEHGKGVGYPVNVDKLIFNLLGDQSKNATPQESLAQFKYEMRNHPRKRDIFDFVETYLDP